MGQITTIGLDIAKSVFQVHGVDAEGVTVLRRRLTRSRLLEFFGKIDPCRVGIEACAAAHHRARELRALGHDVRLMPPGFAGPGRRRATAIEGEFGTRAWGSGEGDRIRSKTRETDEGFAAPELGSARHDVSILMARVGASGRYRGGLSLAKISMMIMRPPQQGHAWVKAFGSAGSAAAGLGCGEGTAISALPLTR